MAIQLFPPLEFADRTGLIAVGGDFELDSLLLAYRSGIFPWPIPDYPLAWFAPPRRAIIAFDAYHPSRSFLRWLKKSSLRVTFDKAFAATMQSCAITHETSNARSKRETAESGTWITPEMIKAYTALHEAGHAHSCEVWKGVELVGGVYGVSIGGMFAAESMFRTCDNASKLALHSLILHLQAAGLCWIDVQVINPFTLSLGATEITRHRFMRLLNTALTQPTIRFEGPLT